MKVILLLVALMCVSVPASAETDAYNKLTQAQRTRLNNFLDEVIPSDSESKDKAEKFAETLNAALESGAKSAKMEMSEYRTTPESNIVILYVLWATFSSFASHLLLGLLVFAFAVRIIWDYYHRITTQRERTNDGDLIEVRVAPTGEEILGIFMFTAATVLVTGLTIFSYS